MFLRDVRKGTLDFTLTKPEDAQLLVSVRAFCGVEPDQRAAGRGAGACGPGAQR